jgi:hypothetical protein
LADGAVTVVVVATDPASAAGEAIAGSADRAHTVTAAAVTDSARTTPARARCPSAGSGLLATPGGPFSLMQIPPRIPTVK